jgi:hypothetical protein
MNLLKKTFLGLTGASASADEDAAAQRRAQQASQDLVGDHDLIVFNILAAKELNKVDLMAGCNPYCVFRYGDSTVGKSTVVQGAVFPRWQNEQFAIRVPVRDGVSELRDVCIEIFSDNSMSRNNVFLGCVYLRARELNDLLDSHTSESSKTNNISLKPPVWYELKKSMHRSEIENKYATQGSLEISVLYVPYYSVDYYQHHSQNVEEWGKLDMHIMAAQGLASNNAPAIVRTTMSTVRAAMRSTMRVTTATTTAAGPTHGKSLFGTLAGGNSTAPVTYCVAYWNGTCVGETQTVGPSNNPVYGDHFLISVPPYFDISECVFELDIYSDSGLPHLKQADRPHGHFLGSVTMTGEDLLEVVSNALDDYGELVFTTVDLDHSPHVDEEDNHAIQGTIQLRGDFRPFKKPSAIDNALEFMHGQQASARWEKIKVVVVEATSLSIVDSLGSYPNAYVVVSWMGREVGRTNVIKDSINPVWLEQAFDLYLPPYIRMVDANLEFRVYEISRFGTHSFLGEHRLRGINLMVCMHSLLVLVTSDMCLCVS